MVGVELLLLSSGNAGRLGSLVLDDGKNGAGDLLGLADLLSARLLSSGLLRVQREEDESVMRKING